MLPIRKHNGWFKNRNAYMTFHLNLSVFAFLGTYEGIFKNIYFLTWIQNRPDFRARNATFLALFSYQFSDWLLLMQALLHSFLVGMSIARRPSFLLQGWTALWDEEGWDLSEMNCEGVSNSLPGQSSWDDPECRLSLLCYPHVLQLYLLKK